MVALAVAGGTQFLYGANYISAEHKPVATDMAFGATGQSPLLSAAQKTHTPLSLKITQYPHETAAKTPSTRPRSSAHSSPDRHPTL